MFVKNDVNNFEAFLIALAVYFINHFAEKWKQTKYKKIKKLQ